MRTIAVALGIAIALAGAAALPSAAAPAPAAPAPPDSAAAKRLVFATFAADPTELRHTLYLAESVRAFGGALREAPVRVYASRALLEAQPELVERLAAAGAAVRAAAAPDDALGFPFARKVFAAAQAEGEAAGAAEVMAWMDEDTIVLQEPRDFLLPAGVSFGYRPVTHRLIGSDFGEPPDEFWRAVYRKLAVPDSAAFAVVTPADSQTIRAYFNAGLLVVRPERGVLERWTAAFATLCGDPEIAEACRQDRYRFLFLHQVALAGAVLSGLARPEMRELPASYNFPIFFKEMYGAKREYNDLTGIATLRYDVYFRNPASDWPSRLVGPRATIDWLAARLGKVEE
jgi:hypothetical protein